MEDRPPNLQQPRGPPLPPASSRRCAAGACRGQPGWRRPVLTKPTGAGAAEHGPAGPGAPAGGLGGGEAEVERLATAQAHSRRGRRIRQLDSTSGASSVQRMRGLWGAPLRPPRSLPAREGKCVRRDRVHLSRFSRWLWAPFGKRNGMAWEGRRCNSWEPPTSAHLCQPACRVGAPRQRIPPDLYRLPGRDARCVLRMLSHS